MTSTAAAETPVGGALATVTIVLSLVLAAWSLLSTARNRPPDRSHLAGLALVELGLLALVVNAALAWAGDSGPGEAATFLGYLVTIVCLPPLAAVLARMEPTRWGSLIVTVICLVIPVLIVRLQQTWQVPGA
ncbi:hypothetical protein AB0J86_31670 [Micromonospora sp. NPDC049559]|uniref:hypothetical protein n=1 Tax=Micromonospora sp. NPDC049559 TaxID=3155923 RepID=UPI00341B3452